MNQLSRYLAQGLFPIGLSNLFRHCLQPKTTVFHRTISIFNSKSSQHTTTANKPAPLPYPSILGKQPDKPTWREAASLIILVQDDNSTNDFDYNILMIKRSRGSSFMASAFVFPGGALELSDFDVAWYNLYEKCGFTKQDLKKISDDVIGPRPPIVSDSTTLSKVKKDQKTNLPFIPNDIGLRISAIRETFEEAGILLLTNFNNRDHSYAKEVTSIDLTEWQHRVRNDSSAFMELCDTLHLVPDVWSLYEWSDWLTPVNVGHKRFDSIFYICCMKKYPDVKVDNAEVVKPIWCAPSEILKEHHQEKVFLAPPQVYELSRMLNFTKLENFQSFLVSRQVLGTQRWLPALFSYKDGSLFILPGDDRYPSVPELVNSQPVPDLNEFIDDANRESIFYNRLELIGMKSRALSNIDPGCGHKAPITFPSK